MLLRKRRQLLIWMFGCCFLIFTLYGVKYLHEMYVYTQMKARLRPGEYVVMLGQLNVEEFLRRSQPDLDGHVIQDFEMSMNFSNPELGRTLPDTRPVLCRSFPNSDHLPITSVVIVYQNEPRVIVLRTIFSILFRSPPELIAEIILVDNQKEEDETCKHLASIPKVRVVSNNRGSGLVSGYNFGVTQATSTAVTFVHAACEVNVGWLQPMLHRLSQQPTAVVTPILDSIDQKTMQYTPTDVWQRGGFKWDMKFQWEPIRIGRSENTNIRTPLYIGHVLSMVRERFISLGMFDPGLAEYGAENIELSFKNWLCNGFVEILPCSRVGQLNLKSELLGYHPDQENIFFKNVKRVVEVWMDDYKRFFYYTRPSARMLSVGSLFERKSLRHRLKCRSFKWYMDHVYPELRPPTTDEVLFGNIQQGELCVDIEIGHVPAIAKLSKCDTGKGTQDWSLKKTGEITNGGMCLTADAVETHGYVMVHFCTGDMSQKWRYANGQITKEGKHMCIDSHKAEIGLVISDCDGLYSSQKWSFASKTVVSRAKDEV